MLKYFSTDQIEYISLYDPALDRSKLDSASYGKTLDQKTYAPVKDGCEPSVFILTGVSRKQDRLIRKLDPSDQMHLKVAFALRGIRNVPDRKGNMVVYKESPTDAGPRASDETLDALYNFNLFEELAAVADRLGHLSPLGE